MKRIVINLIDKKDIEKIFNSNGFAINWLGNSFNVTLNNIDRVIDILILNNIIYTTYESNDFKKMSEEKKIYILKRDCPSIGKEIGDYYNNEYSESIKYLLKTEVIEEEKLK